MSLFINICKINILFSSNMKRGIKDYSIILHATCLADTAAKVLKKKIFSQFFQYYAIISPWRMMWPIIWKFLKALHQGCNVPGLNKIGPDYVTCLQWQQQTMVKFWSRLFRWANNSLTFPVFPFPLVLKQIQTSRSCPHLTHHLKWQSNS